MRTPTEHIKTLQRRIDFLKSREHINSFDKAEVGSLEWALVNLAAQPKEPEQEPVAYCDIHHLPEPCVQCAKEHEGYNIPPQPKETEQEPVAWDGDCVLGHCGSPAGCEASNCCRADSTTSPQRTWVGLTDEDVAEICEQGWQQWLNYQQVAQIVEAKLKGKNT